MTDPEYLDYLIENVVENDYVDYKAKFYDKKDRRERIKDVVAFANSHSREPSRYIFFGVKELNNGKEKEFFDVELEDSNEIQQLLQNNVEPDINIDLYSHNYMGKNLAVLEIKNNENRPYVIKKQGHRLNQGDIFIRSNSTTKKVDRRDLDLMYKNKQDSFNPRNIDISFERSGTKKESFKSIVVDQKDLPSFDAKIYYEERLEKLKRHNSGESNTETNNMLLKGFSLFGEFNQDKIKTGTDYVGMPIYTNEEGLVKQIDNVRENYEDDDNYFMFTNLSQQMNFIIKNKGSSFLNKVLVRIKFPKDIGYIFPQVVPEPKYGTDLINSPISTGWNYSYPSVEIENDYYLVTEYIETLRHKNSELLFGEPLRIILSDKNSNGFLCQFNISAENLPEPIIGNFYIEIIGDHISQMEE